jgi:hypothetical protein
MLNVENYFTTEFFWRLLTILQPGCRKETLGVPQIYCLYFDVLLHRGPKIAIVTQEGAPQNFFGHLRGAVNKKRLKNTTLQISLYKTQALKLYYRGCAKLFWTPGVYREQKRFMNTALKASLYKIQAIKL